MKREVKIEVAEVRKSVARHDDGRAFLPDMGGQPKRSMDDLARELGAEFLLSATSGAAKAEMAFDQEVSEEWGGPFIETAWENEVAGGVDQCNPEASDVEPFPRALGRAPS